MSRCEELIKVLKNPLTHSRPELIRVEEDQFCFKLYFKRANSGYGEGELFRNLKVCLFNSEFDYYPESGTENMILEIVKGPTPESIDLNETISQIIKCDKDEWFIGINCFGYHKLKFSEFNHAMVIGSTGYGKSSLFRLMMMQTIGFKNHVDNIVIDPKGIDYKFLRTHPNVKMYAGSEKEWKDLLKTLVNELEHRQEIFSKYFEVPPNNLDEFLKLRKEYKANHLPDYKRYFVWIDEASLVLNDDYKNQEFRDYIEKLARLGRAFGLHLILSTQRHNDIPHRIRFQFNKYFAFFKPTTGMADVNYCTNPIAGRLVMSYGQYETNIPEKRMVQSPLVSVIDCISICHVDKKKVPKIVKSKDKEEVKIIDNSFSYDEIKLRMSELIAMSKVDYKAIVDKKRIDLINDLITSLKERDNKSINNEILKKVKIPSNVRLKFREIKVFFKKNNSSLKVYIHGAKASGKSIYSQKLLIYLGKEVEIFPSSFLRLGPFENMDDRLSKIKNAFSGNNKTGYIIEDSDHIFTKDQESSIFQSHLIDIFKEISSPIIFTGPGNTKLDKSFEQQLNYIVRTENIEFDINQETQDAIKLIENLNVNNFTFMEIESITARACAHFNKAKEDLSEEELHKVIQDFVQERDYFKRVGI